MRIVYFYQYFTTPRGAWSTRVYEMARRWVDRGDRVTVVTSVYDKSDLRTTRWIESLRVDGIDVVLLDIRLSNKHGAARRLLTFAAYAVLSSWYALRLPADVVVASSGPITVAVPGLVARYVARRRLVFEVRDLWPEGAIQLGVLRRSWAIRAARWLERLCYRAADEVVALSPGQAAGVRRVHPDARVSTVHNASDLSLADRVSPLDPLPEWAAGRHLIVYAGTIGQANDCWQLVRAARHLSHRGRDDIALVLIGDGRDREEIQRRVRTEGLANVHLLGLRPKEEVIAWLHRATASLLVFRDVPVLATCSPNKLFDSLAAGVPVVQTTQGWMKDLLDRERCGITVAPGDTRALAEAMMLLVDRPEVRRSMARRARRVAEAEFDRDDLASRMRAVLVRVAAGRRTALERGVEACGRS